MISSTATHALRAAADLANLPDRYVNRAEFAEATAVPYEYLLKVLNQQDAVLAVDSIPRIAVCPLGIECHGQLCPLHQLLDNAASRLEEGLARAKLFHLLLPKKPRTCNSPKIGASPQALVGPP